MKKVIDNKYEKELFQYGVVPEKEINITTRINICKDFTNRIYETFKNFPIERTQLYMRVYSLKIHFAQIKGIRKVFYFYKNNTIYVEEAIVDKENYKQFLYTEIIHAIQNFGNVTLKKQRSGLVRFKDTKIFGIGLNEGTIQYIVSRMSDNKIQKYSYGFFSIYSISESYRFLTNLIQQIVLLFGEERLFESLIFSNSSFERFFENRYEGETNKLITNLDKLFTVSTTHKHSNKEMIMLYSKTYRIIISKYLHQMLSLITDVSEVKTIKLLLDKLNEIAPDGDTFFFEYRTQYEKELDKLQKRIEEEAKNKALVEAKPNAITKIFKALNDALVNIILE